MIKANELRIGNWVSEPVQGIIQIKGLMTKWAEAGTDDIEYPNLDPIHLSPDILQKCKFRMYPHTPYEMQLEYDNDHWICKRNNGYVYLAYDLESYVQVELPHIDYLHQLQNLYFALTGTELTITL